jgi:predicted membrane protein
MEIKKLLKSFTKLDYLLIVVFILYIVFPIDTPDFLAGLVDSSLGMLTIFIITLYLFFYVNPVVAIVYIFVAYELIRRSSKKTGRVTILQYTPTQKKKDSEMKEMNKREQESLEEEIISQMAPIGRSDPNVYIDSTFKPVADKIKEGSMYQ